MFFFLSLFSPTTNWRLVLVMGIGVGCSPSASTSAGEAVIENNGWMDQWTSLQLTPNYHVIIKIYVKYSLKCSILKILQFRTELICRTEKSVRVQNVTREEREILKNIILSVAGERKPPTICERQKQRSN